ncbi:MAG: DUF421 domain-containing protein [Halanaerobiales bacterium]
MFGVIVKTVIIYFIILILVRIMGKREIGQLSPFDFVVAIMIAEMAVIPIEDKNLDIFHGMVPIVILVILEIIIAYISLKSNLLRGIITGRPQVLIDNGTINYENLKKTRYNINDLLMQLRIKDIFNIDEVELAILETSGELSVVKKDTTLYGFPVVIDGKLTNNSQISRVSKEWVKKEVSKQGASIEDLALVTVDKRKKIKIYFKH